MKEHRACLDSGLVPHAVDDDVRAVRGEQVLEKLGAGQGVAGVRGVQRLPGPKPLGCGQIVLPHVRDHHTGRAVSHGACQGVQTCITTITKL